MKLGLAIAAGALCIVARSFAQICPPDDGTLTPGKATTISGTIRHHVGLRDWVGLELSPDVCGQQELQLTFIAGDSTLNYQKVKTLDGCHVTATGSIEYSPTARYSMERYIQDGKIEPDSSCRPKALTPDPANSSIPADLHRYQVKVSLNFANTAEPMHGVVRQTDGNNQELVPWQAYVNPWLNGSEDLLWVSCRDGFHLQDAVIEADGKFGKPQDWLNKETPGLSASEKPGPSSVTITCARSAPP